MRPFIRCLFILCLYSLALPVQAAWGDVSYDPNPALFDEDRNAQFDMFGFLSHVVSTTNGSTKATQNFENGFSAGQQLNDWVALGSTRVRFGFGDTLDTVQWKSRIGGIDAASSQFGLTHPHGTYGNAPGVTDQARNYVADLHFLTPEQTANLSGPSYFVIQFEQPVSFISFSMIDYASGSGGNFDFSLWNGGRLDQLVQLVTATGSPSTIPVGQVDGDFQYLVRNGIASAELPYRRPTFNFAILHLDTPDATLGFDNFTAGLMPVPEPETYALMAMGLLLMGVVIRSSRRSDSK